MLLGSTNESDGTLCSQIGRHLRETAQPRLLQNSTASQEERAAQLAQMAGQLRRNAEHFSGTLVADQAVLRVAEKVGSSLDVIKRERVQLRDHGGKALRTTCLMISSVVVAIASLVLFFVIRFT
ncbi:hypothetical protein EI94DRAFT_1206616 [Lactarius quietus]|nr:hypothetical protein EI94DRAFT_1206616 [Lactarius quietus]